MRRQVYPIYSHRDLYFAEQDGNYEVSDFAEFISALIQHNAFQTEAERGVTAFINSKGTELLTDNQIKVLEILIARYDKKRCKFCDEKIPLNEVFDDNDGFCADHKKKSYEEEYSFLKSIK